MKVCLGTSGLALRRTGSSRRDEWNTGNYETDSRPPGRVLTIDPATPSGSVFVVHADVEAGRHRVSAEVHVYTPEANPLVPLDHTADGSNTPAYKSVIVRLEPAAGQRTGVVYPTDASKILKPGRGDEAKRATDPSQLS